METKGGGEEEVRWQREEGNECLFVYIVRERALGT